MKLLEYLKTYFKNNYLTLPLLFIILYIIFANYEPGTYLTGWDTLHPEFNYRIYWSRILDGVWQEHQGLGAVSTQAHASEIPRILIMMLLDIFLSTSMVRYVYAFLMLILGPLGVYAFTKHIFQARSTGSREFAGFAAGLFYLLNLVTLQHFYVPLEMFLTHYGFLGWIFLYTVKFIQQGSREKLIKFSLVTFFAASQAHTATLFYAFVANYAVFLSLYAFTRLVVRDWSHIRRVAGLFILMFLLNLFWLLPNIYFAVTHGQEVQTSKIHALFSEEAFLQNKEFGTLEDAAIGRSFLFNWGEHTGNAQFGELLNEWKVHHLQPYVLSIGYIVFALVLVGVVFSLLTRNLCAFCLLGIFLTSLFFIFNVNPPAGWLFVWFQDNIPLFQEAFRFPFTKFSITLVFSYAFFFGYLAGTTSNLINKLIQNRQIKTVSYSGVLLILVLSLGYYALPMFQGNLISPSMRVAIPQRYFQLFDYMDNQSDYGRIANLPIHSFWGWVYHDWNAQTKLGYQGAGFLWFGLKQPLLDREFDRWNIINENYYNQMANAIYSQDIIALEQVLEQYKVKWLLVDKSVLTISADPKQLFFEQIDSMVAMSSKIKLEKDFGEGLKLYTYTPDKPFALKEMTTDFYYSGNTVSKEYSDPIYQKFGDYVALGTAKSHPFVGISNQDESLNKAIVTSDDNFVYLKSPLLQQDLQLSPGYVQYQVTYANEELLLIPLNTLSLASSEYILRIPLTLTDTTLVSLNKVIVNPHEDIILLNQQEPLVVELFTQPVGITVDAGYFSQLDICSDSGSRTTYTLQREVDGFKLFAKEAKACVTAPLSTFLSTEAALTQSSDTLLIQLTGESLGTNPEICLFDEIRGLCQNSPLVNGKSFAVVSGTDLAKYYLRFSANGLGKRDEVGVYYKNVSVSFLQPFFSAVYSLPLNATNSVTTFSDLRFHKPLGFGGAVVDLENDPRLCNGQRDFDDAYVSRSNQSFAYISNGESLCDSFSFPTARHDIGHILELEARNVEGTPLRVCLTNEYSKHCDIYQSLDSTSSFTKQYYLIPPTDADVGYTLNVSNLTFGSSTSINELKYIALTPIPWESLRNVHTHLSSATDKFLLKYNQAYEPGWIALCGVKTCDAQHVLVNNWANGWIFDESTDVNKIKIVFWPQILEYAGLMILLGLAGFIWHYRQPESKIVETEIKSHRHQSSL